MITYEDAFKATSSDPHAYPGLDPNNYSEDDLNKRRDSAAQAIMQGIAANDQYWNSRSELEALRAQADGHSVVVNGDATGTDPNAPAAVRAADAEGTAVDESAAAGHLSAGGDPVADATVVPSDANQEAVIQSDQAALDKLRAQLRDAGIDPEA